MENQNHFDHVGAAFELLRQITHVNLETLVSCFNNNENYRNYYIPKPKGGYRNLSEPQEDVKIVQQQLLKNFFYRLYWKGKISPRMYAFIPKRSVPMSLQLHTEADIKYILQLDLKDAFPSVTADSISTLLQGLVDEREKYGRVFKSQSFDKKMLVNSIKIFRSALPKEIYNAFRSELNFSFVKSIGKYGYTEQDLEKWNNEINAGLEGTGMQSKDVRFWMWSWKSEYPEHPLFPAHRAYDFRKLIREESETGDYGRSKQILDSFIRMVVEIVTYKGVLPQGAPTSGFILALLASQKGILPKILSLMRQEKGYKVGRRGDRYLPGLPLTLSMYADDIVIGLSHNPDAQLIEKICQSIESSDVFKVNPNKIKVYNRRYYDPTILGLRLSKHVATTSELAILEKAEIRGIARALSTGRPWTVHKVTLPKKIQKRYRAFLHKIVIVGPADSKSIAKACGYIGHIVSVYGGVIGTMPKQLQKPVASFSEMMGTFRDIHGNKVLLSKKKKEALVRKEAKEKKRKEQLEAFHNNLPFNS